MPTISRSFLTVLMLQPDTILPGDNPPVKDDGQYGSRNPSKGPGHPDSHAAEAAGKDIGHNDAQD